MATRPLAEAEALPAFEPLVLEQTDALAPIGFRYREVASWARGAFLLDAVMLVDAALAADLGSREAGIVRASPVWLAAYGAIVLVAFYLRGLYSWRVRLQVLDDGRAVLGWAQLKARRDGELARPTLIVGAGRVGRLAARRLIEHPEFGLLPIGFLDKEPLEEPGLPVPVLGASWDLERMIDQYHIEHVVVTFSTAPSEVLLREI